MSSRFAKASEHGRRSVRVELAPAVAGTRAPKTKVLLILPAYLSTRPGLDPFWLETAGLAEAVASLVDRCDVLTPYGLFSPHDLKGFAMKRASPAGPFRQGLHRLPRVIRVLLGDGRSWWRAQQLKRLALGAVGESSYQLVIQVHRRFHTAGLHAAKKSDAPFVLKMVALEVREEEGWGIHRPWGSLVERFGELRIIEKADVVVPVSAELDATLASVGVPDEVRLVLDNAVDLQLFSPTDAAQGSRPPELGSHIVAGWVGSFQPFHGLHLLPDIARRLEVEAPEVMLCLVGNGPLFETVAASVQDRRNVYLVGAVGHEEVPRWIRWFDMAFLLADDSAFHYSPLKLYEYLACGCPVVAAQVGEVAEVMQHERVGLLVPPGDSVATTSAITRLARDSTLRKGMAVEARSLAERRGSWRTRAETLLTFLTDRGLL